MYAEIGGSGGAGAVRPALPALAAFAHIALLYSRPPVNLKCHNISQLPCHGVAPRARPPFFRPFNFTACYTPAPTDADLNRTVRGGPTGGRLCRAGAATSAETAGNYLKCGQRRRLRWEN
ncbi:hypothetical protein EVAR_59297_1 [Eumeta japonica]|uniref:Uncharacterized protein n=1 Tax=Eumeta variegata TaxID=151549 RepID=A0A4C1YAV1_EUMVA|nr:hypothetical protein EVAR_59297_1 [Eumeta japonica]